MPKSRTDKRKHVLWIDDRINKFSAEAGSIILGGYDLVCVSELEEFTYWLNTRDFDLVIIDIQLNSIRDGYDLAEHVRTNYPSIKILIYSAMIDKEKDFLVDSNGIMSLSVSHKRRLPSDTSPTKVSVALGKLLSTEKPETISSKVPKIPKAKRKLSLGWSFGNTPIFSGGQK